MKIIQSNTKDLLFKRIETEQNKHGWQNKKVLDAGTGFNSLEWLLSLPCKSIAAVTGDALHAKSLQSKLSNKLHSEVEILFGNWVDPKFMNGKKFDIIIADYLIGALDGFSPYFQNEIFHRLYSLLETNGRIYFIGLEPIGDQPSSLREQLIIRMTKLRDACTLLAGHRCYREYPEKWILHELKRKNFNIIFNDSFTNLYSYDSICKQLDVAKEKALLFDKQENTDFQVSALAKIRDLKTKAKEMCIHGPIVYGFDYVIGAVKDTFLEGF